MKPASQVFGKVAPSGAGFDIETYKQGIRDALERHVPSHSKFAKKPAKVSLLGPDIEPVPDRPAKKERAKPDDWNPDTKKFYEKLGYKYQRVDWFDVRTMKAHDFLGFADAIGLKDGSPPVLIQLTSKGHLNERTNKILESKNAKNWLSTGSRIEAIGWQKVGKDKVQTRHEIFINGSGDIEAKRI